MGNVEAFRHHVSHAIEYRRTIHALWTNLYERAARSHHKAPTGEVLFPGFNHMPPDNDVRAWHDAMSTRMTAITALSSRFDTPDLIIDVSPAGADLTSTWRLINEMPPIEHPLRTALIVGEVSDRSEAFKHSVDLQREGVQVVGAAFMVDDGRAAQIARELGKPVAAALRIVNSASGPMLMPGVQACRLIHPAA